MNTCIIPTQRLDEDIANTVYPSRGNPVPPLNKVATNDQAPVNAPPLADSDIRVAFVQMDQAINTQAQAVTTKS